MCQIFQVQKGPVHLKSSISTPKRQILTEILSSPLGSQLSSFNADAGHRIQQSCRLIQMTCGCVSSLNPRSYLLLSRCYTLKACPPPPSLPILGDFLLIGILIALAVNSAAFSANHHFEQSCPPLSNRLSVIVVHSRSSRRWSHLR